MRVVTHDWSDIRGRLARLAVVPDADKVFGASGHGWLLEPPLSPAELREIEDQLRVALPQEYRSFLLAAGRGGAGPSYGLFPVHRVDGRWQWAGDGAELTDLETLAQPFPHVAAFNPVDGLPDPPKAEDFDSTASFNAAEYAYWDTHDELLFRPEHSVGLLYLCHLGCAYREALVVSGPARGQMWADDTAGDGGFLPLVDDTGARLGFAAWFRKWLDGTEAQLTNQPPDAP